MSVYTDWVKTATADSDLLPELAEMDGETIEDAFYRDLAFGTGGLRGVIGAGTNRMNVYTVARASQGLANFLLKNYSAPSVVIGYDSRIKSELFAKVAAGVFADCGIAVHMGSELLPVPTVSFAARCLQASAGVMITASHNPAQYNGYKVYGADGCQITTEAAVGIQAEIDKIGYFDNVIETSPKVEYIDASVLEDYLEEVRKQSVLFGDEVNRDVSIVYSPLNGTGLKPVTSILKASGFTKIHVVSEQENPDGRFPTCPYPNPEIHEAMELGLRDCELTGADLLLATDPDCDRCGIAVRNGGDEYQLLSGNEVGILLLDFICSQRVKHHRMPERPVFIKTIVTMDLAERIAAHYEVETINVLTGFKFIGEQIGLLERQRRENDYICGFEESYGYLTGSYVRDKDAVNAALLICEMFAYYKIRGISLLQKLDELYKTYGYCMNTLHSYTFNGSTGMVKMQMIMARYRSGIHSIGECKVETSIDYIDGLDGLPKSDVIKFCLSGGNSVVIRPSGTEPKLKAYVSVTAKNKAEAVMIEEQMTHGIESTMA